MSLWMRALRTIVIPVVALGMSVSTQAWAAPGGEAASVRTTAVSPALGVVNLNTATEDELIALPGVGPAKAAAIVAWRKKHGPFKRVGDLLKVRGFGRKTLAKLGPYLTLTGPTTYRGVRPGCARLPLR